MLDFYKISDSAPKPDYPEKINLERIDGLNLNDFEDLKCKNLIPEKSSFWIDFRWDANSTLKIYHLILKTYPELSANKLKIKSVTIFYNIVYNAVKDGLGLIAYCD